RRPIQVQITSLGLPGLPGVSARGYRITPSALCGALGLRGKITVPSQAENNVAALRPSQVASRQRRPMLTMRSMKHVMLAITACVVLGCATVVRWDRPGTTDQQFLADRYACIQEAPVSSASGYSYGGSAVATVSKNMGIFEACMAARGYTRN